MTMKTNFLNFKANFSRRYYSTNSYSSTNNLDPWFITGLTDADGSFFISLIWRSNYWEVVLKYSVIASINPINLKMLQSIQKFFW
jgi:hypothetical protein